MNLIFTLLFLFIGTDSYAQDCVVSDANTNNAAEYLEKMAESLTRVKAKLKRVKSLPSKKNIGVTDVFVSLKELKASYTCASNIVGSYKDSANENIAKSAEGLSKAYQLLASTTEQSIEEMRQDLDGKLNQSPGEKAERSAETMLDIKKTWEIVIKSIAVGTYSAIGKENPKTKKMDNLIITRKERDAIVRTLKSDFTLPLKKGDNDGVDVAAEVYYQFLKEDWKLKEVK